MIELILLFTCVAIIGGGVLYGRYVEKHVIYSAAPPRPRAGMAENPVQAEKIAPVSTGSGQPEQAEDMRATAEQFSEHLSEILKSMSSADIKVHARPRATAITSAKAAIRFEKSGKSRMQPVHGKKGRKLPNIPARHLKTTS